MNSNDSQQTISELVSFIRSTCSTTKLSDAIIGVSGGIDSATSLALTVKALGQDHVFPIMLPYGSLNSKGIEDGQLVIQSLNIPKDHVQIIDIQPMVDSVIKVDPTMEDLRKGNIMARMRMIILFDQAKKRRGLVVGTENKTEHYLGYFTRFGDEASDIEPLRNLFKTEVYQLAKAMDIPEPLLVKAPTAGLWEGQTDEKEFGFSYVEADKVLREYEKQTQKDNVLMVPTVKPSVVDAVLNRIQLNKFKHSLPYIL